MNIWWRYSNTTNSSL